MLSVMIFGKPCINNPNYLNSSVPYLDSTIIIITLSIITLVIKLPYKNTLLNYAYSLNETQHIKTQV
jgi:hypothetical protein